MGREGHWIDQPVDQVVDVANWKGDDEFEVYPEGARDKSLLISPEKSQYGFLIPNHRYLFKHSFKKKDRYHPDQFWSEIIAYRIGCLLNVPDQPEERRVHGGDIMVDMIPGYDRRKGKEHNFVTIERYLSVVEKLCVFESDWRFYWCDMLLFDALIGNTDRHQDNWELLWNQEQDKHVRMSPVFDNGTSLGYEILESKMGDFYHHDKMKYYIGKGRHHLRWQLKDELQCQHLDLLRRLTIKFPKLNDRIKEKLALFEPEQLRSILEICKQYVLPVRLSRKRADFICHLVLSRHTIIKEAFS